MDEAGSVLELARRLALEAGEIQRERYETRHDIATKSVAVDLVTEVDRLCEERILEGIARERPEDAVLAEESGAQERPDAEWRWVIDPLDGTTNYAHGYPAFCVSIGVERAGARSVGVIYEPLRRELYTAVRGRGAQRNDEPIRVSREAELGRAMLATGFAYDPGVRRRNLAAFGAFVQRSRAVRRGGSAALDLCYLACGRFDGYWEPGLHPWDVAAGLLLVEEAGGRLSDFDGGPVPASGDQVVATNGPLHDAVLAVLSETLEG